METACASRARTHGEEMRRKRRRRTQVIRWFEPTFSFFIALFSSWVDNSIDWVVGAWHLRVLPCQNTLLLPPAPIHTSLPWTVGGSKHRPTLKDPQPVNLPPLSIFAGFYSKRLHPHLAVIAVYIFFSFILFTLEKVGFIQCYRHWVFFSRRFCAEVPAFSSLIYSYETSTWRCEENRE